MSPLPTPGGCVVMGVLNVTADSFSDGGRYLDLADAVAHGLALRDQGWGGTTLLLPEGTWRDALGTATGLSGAVPLETLLADLPVALLVRED